MVSVTLFVSSFCAEKLAFSLKFVKFQMAPVLEGLLRARLFSFQFFSLISPKKSRKPIFSSTFKPGLFLGGL